MDGKDYSLVTQLPLEWLYWINAPRSSVRPEKENLPLDRFVVAAVVFHRELPGRERETPLDRYSSSIGNSHRDTEREPALDRFFVICFSHREEPEREKPQWIVFFDLEQPERDRQRRTPLDCYSPSTGNLHNPHFDHSATTTMPPQFSCHVPSGFLLSNGWQRGPFQRDRLVQSVLHGITKSTTGSDGSAEVCWGNRKSAPLGLSWLGIRTPCIWRGTLTAQPRATPVVRHKPTGCLVDWCSKWKGGSVQLSELKENNLKQYWLSCSVQCCCKF